MLCGDIEDGACDARNESSNVETDSNCMIESGCRFQGRL